MYSREDTGLCPTGKRRYDSQRGAQIALVEAIVGRNYGKNHRKECRFYHCHICSGWHLTSEPHRAVRVLSRTAADDSTGYEGTSSLCGEI